MNITSSLPPVAAIALAFLTTYLLGRGSAPPPEKGRISSLDGLRGYLALFVFLCHSMVWYFYLRNGQWTVPPSNLYAHFGQSGVAFFFMITGFLFFSKLLSSRGKEMDWGKLYVSRVLRLTPLYLFTMALLFIIVIVLSSGEVRQDAGTLAGQIGAWLGFTLMGMPNINGVDGTFRIIAGVPWSLPYEWLFYLSLPLVALLTRVRVPVKYVLMSVVTIAGFVIVYDKMNSLILFPVGMASAVLARDDRFKKLAASSAASVVIIACMVVAVMFYSSAHALVPLMLVSISFALIAGGNSLFGILTNATSRAFGETAYSLYLLHGLLLFVVFHFVIGESAARALTPVQHWLAVLAMTPVLVVISHFTFRLIEAPCMHRTEAATAWLRRLKRRADTASPAA